MINHQVPGFNIIKGSTKDFDGSHSSAALSTEETSEFISNSYYVPYIQVEETKIPPIASILRLKTRLHVATGAVRKDDILQETIFTDEVMKEENKKKEEVRSAYTSEKKQASQVHKENETAFDLGTSTLQRIINQMRDMRTSASKYSYKPVVDNKKVHKTASCLPTYTDYLRGKANTNWELEKKKHLAEMLTQ